MRVAHTLVSCFSLLEQVLKGLARIVRRPRVARRRLSLDRRARGIESTFVLGIFLGDPLRNRLSALKPGRGVEIDALLAAMQLKAATRAPAGGIKIVGKDPAASRAAHHRVRPRHLRSLRAKRLWPWTCSLTGLAFPPVSVVILVASLAIFSVAHSFSTPGFFDPAVPLSLPTLVERLR